jgi:hypothetical protein
LPAVPHDPDFNYQYVPNQATPTDFSPGVTAKFERVSVRWACHNHPPTAMPSTPPATTSDTQC